MNHKQILHSIGRSVIFGALCVVFFVPQGYSQSTVTVNINGATNVIPNQLFGTLMERLGRQWGNGTNGGIFVGTSSSIPNTNGMRNDVINAFKECGVGAAQWPGGCAAINYTWNPPNPANDVGTDRFLQFCQLIGMEPLICGPFATSTAASNLAWIKHIDSVTAQRGMDSLRWFKIGNEVWGGCGSGVTAAAYCTNFLAHYTPIHAYRPSLKLEGCNQNEDRGFASVSSWEKTVVSTLGDKMDGLEYHDYIYRTSYNSLSFTTAQYWQIMYDGTVGDFAGHIRTNVIPVMDTADPTKRVKILVDEWGDWLTGDNWMQTATMMDALSAANHLHLMMRYTDRIAVACLAQGVNVIHSLLNINTSNVMIKTPTFYLFKMFKPHHSFGAKWAPITASTIETTSQAGTTPLLTVGTTVDTNGRVNISVNNIDLTANRQITINLTSNQSSYVIDSAQIITGPAMNSNNPFGGTEVVNIQNFAASNYTLTNNGKTLTATMPARSVVMFRLKAVGGVNLNQPEGLQMKSSDAFSIKAGPQGAVMVASSISRKTPVTIGLYTVTGKLMSKMAIDFQSPNKAYSLCSNLNSGIYMVRIEGNNSGFSKNITIVR